MILIDKETRLSIKACDRKYNGAYYVHFQVYKKCECGSLNLVSRGFLLPENAIERLIIRLEEAKEALTLVEKCAFYDRTPKTCTTLNCAAKPGTDRCEISLEGKDNILVNDGEARLTAMVFGFGFVGAFFAHFDLQRWSEGAWRYDGEGFRIPANAIDHLVAELGQVKADIEDLNNLEIQTQVEAMKRERRKESQRLLARTEEKIRQFLSTGAKSELELKEGSQWERKEHELYSFEKFYACAVENLTSNKEIRWNEEINKWELNPWV